VKFDTAPSYSCLDDLRRAVLDMNRAVPQDGTPQAAHALAVVAAIDKPLTRNRGYTPSDRPVTRFLQQCLNDLPTVYPALVSTLREIGSFLHWQTNANYKTVFSQHFLDNESFAEVIGPDGLLSSPDVRICLMMMGRDTHYPLHNHEPTELYHVISGTGWWRKGDEDWSQQPSGGVIFHDVFQGHEMRTESEPFLTIASWVGDLSSGEAKPIN